MTTSIHKACAADGCCVLSDGTMKPADILPKLLSALAELAPAVHQQITMPGCGFSLVPAYALEDEESDWWDTEAADGALFVLFDALNEHAPEGFTFSSNEGDGACFGFWRIDDEPDPSPRESAIVYKLAECLELGVEPDVAQQRAAEYADTKLARPCFSAGLTPNDVVAQHARLHCTGGFFPMRLVDSLEWRALAKAWNQGIDSHLEAITERSTADERTGEVRVHVDELATLCRRLNEIADNYDGPDSDSDVSTAAGDLRASIIDCLGIEEV